jgi:spore maturation protein CgeB
MKFVFFYHSFTSCWNHGNAHFLRGIARELVRLRHDVVVYEPSDGWSRTNALRDGGRPALAEAERLVPGVTIHRYHGSPDLDRALDGADVAIVHEWNEPDLAADLGWRRIRGGRFRLLFHDTHHRSVSAPDDIEHFDLSGFDAVLAFGAVLRELYAARGWGRRAFTWHEAADTALFRPHGKVENDTDVIWIGNWGDDERTKELEEFLLGPVTRLGASARIHGVRYPQDVLAELSRRGIAFSGWLPNHRVPDAFAKAAATVHIPRRPYVEALSGIPTIRVFEALACGIPLVCAPWSDAEDLFPAGSYLIAKDGDGMQAALGRVLRDQDLAAAMARTGLAAIRARHTCAHRVAELLAVLEKLTGQRAHPPVQGRNLQEQAAP